METARRVIQLISLILVVLFVLAAWNPQAVAQVPERAYQHQRDALRIWTDSCPEAPIAMLAGQIHQESAWRHDARSPYAHGLAQFTPPTAGDMAKWYADLRPADTGDPRWSLRAQALYMCRIHRMYRETSEPWLFALSGYNGGPGWTNRDIRVCAGNRTCDPWRWAGHVSATPDLRRARHNITENRQYVWRIVKRNQHFYQNWGRAEPVPESWQR